MSVDRQRVDTDGFGNEEHVLPAHALRAARGRAQRQSKLADEADECAPVVHEIDNAFAEFDHEIFAATRLMFRSRQIHRPPRFQ